MGSHFGLWAAAEGNLADAEHALAKWKAHANKLQKRLDELREWYDDKSAEAVGQAALKEAALAELKRFDPTNKLLDQAYRKTIYDEAKAKSIAELKKDRQ